MQLYIHMHLFFVKFFSHLGYYRTLSRVPCALQWVPVGCLFYIESCLCVNPKLSSYPFLALFPFGNHEFTKLKDACSLEEKL